MKFAAEAAMLPIDASATPFPLLLAANHPGASWEPAFGEIILAPAQARWD
jgi:hypothetical protein